MNKIKDSIAALLLNNYAEKKIDKAFIKVFN